MKARHKLAYAEALAKLIAEAHKLPANAEGLEGLEKLRVTIAAKHIQEFAYALRASLK